MTVPTASVVICAYTERRWTQLLAAIDSASAQPEASEVIVVVDHNDDLLSRVEDARPSVRLVSNRHRRGLSGARNSGVEVARSDVVAFLDDDAEAHAGWLHHLLAPFDDGRVEGVGGRAVPAWPEGCPVILPAELYWVVGCTFTGQPTSLAPVRNVMGCSMAFRRTTVIARGGFDEQTGRVGGVPLGGEETDLCIRIVAARPDARILFEPRSVVSHAVSRDRMTWGYLRRRSFFEGVTKAVLARKLGRGPALSTEIAYTRSVLPRALVREVLSLTPSGLRRSAAIVTALVAAAAGYGSARLRRPVL